MIETIVFDIGNVILYFDFKEMSKNFTDNEEIQQFLYENVYNSPEWCMYGLMDTGYFSIDEITSIIQDRTNNKHDQLIKDIMSNYNKYMVINDNIIELVKKLRQKYKIYLLSNINDKCLEVVKNSELLENVDGYILSSEVHKIKPYTGIFKELINKFDLDVSKTLYIDDNANNIKTGEELGFISRKVNQNDYDDLLEILREEKVYE